MARSTDDHTALPSGDAEQPVKVTVEQDRCVAAGQCAATVCPALTIHIKE
ncbi:hypothetical protein [Streptomyces sp. NPDC002156]